MADVCSLEDTEFANGINKEDYWSSTFSSEEDTYTLPNYDLSRTRKYFEENWKSGSVKKAIVYGIVFGLALGFCTLNKVQFYVNYRSNMTEMVLSLMFSVREMTTGYLNDGAMPPRYHQYRVCNSEEDLLRAMVDCFRGDLPSYLYAIEIDEAACDGLFKYVPCFNNLRYFELEIDQKLGSKVKELVVRITREAVNLEVLILNYNAPGTKELPVRLPSLDRILLELAESSFVSRLHMLVAFCFGLEHNVDMEKGFFTVSSDALKKLLDAFLSAPSNHSQLVRLEGTTVACNTLQELHVFLQGMEGTPPEKTIEFYKCKFSVVDAKF